jgi:hypothetical protein
VLGFTHAEEDHVHPELGVLDETLAAGTRVVPAGAEKQKPVAANVARSAQIGEGVTLGDHVQVHGQARIGAGSVVGEHSVIGKGAQVGARVWLGEGVVVEAGAIVPDDSVVPAGSRITPVRDDLQSWLVERSREDDRLRGLGRLFEGSALLEQPDADADAESDDDDPLAGIKRWVKRFRLRF